MAAQVLAVAAPGIAPPRPVRQSGEIAAPGRARAAPDWPRRWPRSPARRWRPCRRGGWPCSVRPSCCPSWPVPSPTPGSTRPTPVIRTGDGLAAGLVLLPADETNGLEFDAVVVVEPALVAAVGERSAGEGPPVATTRGSAHPLRGAHPTDPTAGRRPCRAAPDPPGDPDGAMKPSWAQAQDGATLVTCLLARHRALVD